MSFELGGSVVAPGTREIVELPLAQLPVGAKVALKVIVIHGARPGPTCFLSAAIHGDTSRGERSRWWFRSTASRSGSSTCHSRDCGDASW